MSVNSAFLDVRVKWQCFQLTAKFIKRLCNDIFDVEKASTSFCVCVYPVNHRFTCFHMQIICFSLHDKVIFLTAFTTCFSTKAYADEGNCSNGIGTTSNTTVCEWRSWWCTGQLVVEIYSKEENVGSERLHVKSVPGFYTCGVFF